MHKTLKTIGLVAAAVIGFATTNKAYADTNEDAQVRERLLMDQDWRFAFGHSTDWTRDYAAVPPGTAFSYFTKAGRAEGAAGEKFDDSGWRVLDLPHDWVVELPFDSRGSHSHGYKAVGQVFPENSIGWYRRHFDLPKSDLGRRIGIEFDGVFRDSQVWVNGFYLGRESSGYTSFAYDMTDYLNYGGENVIVVRADASLEEGWFYEGAGIYRNVWLTKTSPLHVAHWGTFVSTETKNDGSADVSARVTVRNDGSKAATFEICNQVLDADGQTVASSRIQGVTLAAGASAEYPSEIRVENPKLWDLETPYQYTLVTLLAKKDEVVDRFETPFGIRTIQWTGDKGFLLNGKRVEIKGTNNHQDHAGVGSAISDSLNYERIRMLKGMGVNAYRTSHNPPTPEMLDACDKLGMLVLDENRETGINPQQLDGVRDMILRDRNHPCVILWSVGNEEWAFEGSDKGAMVTRTMQNYARQLDPTRPSTVAISGGWGVGSSSTTEVMGFNYFNHGSTDEYHAKFPNVPTVGTEESACYATRGIYFEDRPHCYLTEYDIHTDKWFTHARESIQHYMDRPWAAGQFRWTGFDYRGEPSPFGWPAISSQFGAMDTCGFPKDEYYLYKAWWGSEPLLHIFPHWNWQGREGQEIDVWAYGNCEEVELFLNGKSLGRQTMPKYGNCAWKVKYVPGKLLAKGYTDGKEVLTDSVETTGPQVAVKLAANKAQLDADGDDVALVTVEVLDAEGRHVPTASNLVQFDIYGPAKIIGVGNGDPTCHEADKYAQGQQWQRSLFNGLAQVIVQTERGKSGTIVLKARSEGLNDVSIKLESVPVSLRPSVPVVKTLMAVSSTPVPVLVEVEVPAKPKENPQK